MAIVGRIAGWLSDKVGDLLVGDLGAENWSLDINERELNQYLFDREYRLTGEPSAWLAGTLESREVDNKVLWKREIDVVAAEVAQRRELPFVPAALLLEQQIREVALAA